MSLEEVALVGWKEIARFLGWKVSKAKSRKKVWKDDYGILFYTWQGKPPNRHKMVYTFPSMLQRVAVIKASKGELL